MANILKKHSLEIDTQKQKQLDEKQKRELLNKQLNSKDLEQLCLDCLFDISKEIKVRIK